MTHPIKVAIIISSLNTGGKEYVAVNIMRNLNPKLFEPILCVMNRGELLPLLADQRVYANLVGFRGNVLGFAWRLFRLLQRERPQIVYCLSYRVPGWFGRIIGKLLGIPVLIYELHGAERVGERTLDWVDRTFFNAITDHMIAIGDDLRQSMIQDGFPSEKITVIPNGIDTSRFSPVVDKDGHKMKVLNLAADTLVIGCITKMRPKKNLPMLIDAFQLVLQSVPKARLIMAGDGSERPNLEAYIEKLGLADKISLLGLRSDVAELMNCCDVIALSSTTEAAPLAILEAGACGVPVVSTAVGEIPDMIINGQTGFLVPSGDTHALSQRLTELLIKPELRAQMGGAARQHIVEHFSLGASIRAREDLFMRLLADKGFNMHKSVE